MATARPKLVTFTRIGRFQVGELAPSAHAIAEHQIHRTGFFD